jgi:gas vesicle protein
VAAETVGKEKTTRQAFAPFFDFGGYDFKGFEAATQTWKDLCAQQVRATQIVAEQGMALSRKATEYWSTQTQEALKYQQEAVKFTLGVADDVRKAAFETAERAAR